jgi:hypothetical protein
MNPIKRRFFYDSLGHIFFETNAYGESTVEQDIADFTILSERNRDTFNVIELPFGAYAQDFAECVLVGIDLVTKEPIFAVPDPSGEPVVLDKPLSVQINEANATIVRLESMNTLANEDFMGLVEVLTEAGVI